MDDLKKYITIITASIVCVVFVYVFYGIYLQFEVENRKYRIDGKAQIWIKNKPKSYSYVVREGCMFTRAYQVIHKNGEDLYFDFEEFCDPNEGPKCDPVKYNIIGVFEKIKEASVRAEMLDVKYNALGYPEKVDIDWRRDAVDDECFISIEDFNEI